MSYAKRTYEALHEDDPFDLEPPPLFQPLTARDRREAADRADRLAAWRDENARLRAELAVAETDLQRERHGLRLFPDVNEVVLYPDGKFMAFDPTGDVFECEIVLDALERAEEQLRPILGHERAAELLDAAPNLDGERWLREVTR